MSTRRARVERTTNETKVSVEIDLDGTGRAEISTGVGFYDHMLNQIARHGGFDLTVQTVGDLEIDAHHTMEDTAIALGTAFAEALGDKAGIVRYGSATVPMDEVLVRAAVDLSGRAYVVHDEPPLAPYIGPVYPTSMTRHIFESFGLAAKVTLHVDVLRAARPGGNPDAHHVVEAQFKALSRALREAVAIDPRSGGAVPSTKGAL
ncbi:imidazoleglycerol-phosphate dehydratase [Asanoa ishikariensis]|uniref:Imidazoleglycerol-phosphate dehydratase n=1 Tax=Asanoa ishikariensis TaxID=137265 RepID=A0A1H3P7K7_9ACTN|nr:imidazoleglycerol-phosphate dehydratase HisB [Asanoa ishikariensis]GIF68043.1 imidazoleglycerol-phosphate dehydratase [Asanoa ishikariensis]SDY97144.1 imidazoleglycerol-phosphate dehydratase [Asanoa ishikariensis]